MAGQWKTWEPMGHIGQDLVGRTLGIVGMGRIGYAMARRCHGGWGMRVLYHDQRAHEQAERELGAERVEFDTLLADSDFISAHADLNDTTRGMFNAAAFAKMKPTAVFVNTARGPLVVEADLAAALRQGHHLRRRARRHRSRTAACRQSAGGAAQLHRRPAHRQRHGQQPQRDGRDRRRQSDRRTQGRAAAGLGESGSGGEPEERR